MLVPFKKYQNGYTVMDGKGVDTLPKKQFLQNEKKTPVEGPEKNIGDTPVHSEALLHFLKTKVGR